jgi:hypothetical protein
MSEDEKRGLRAEALLAYQESTQELALIREKARNMGAALVEIGGWLQNDLNMFVAQNPTLPTQDAAQEIIKDYLAFSEEVEKRYYKAQELGVSIPDTKRFLGFSDN